ncbi:MULTISPECIES: hypothetical protein [Streptosporangium]|uniref:Uncharacterized protein n=1 Tax=Streptosporangium brasiliense TaxID=47480 RepID=A0ABT9RK39_9ACTN|nr:hypothetical protein [Streptosporangium brasiliense]MDP9869666.1 hypothetical protein [Streptosporangium brasiliense]
MSTVGILATAIALLAGLLGLMLRAGWSTSDEKAYSGAYLGQRPMGMISPEASVMYAVGTTMVDGTEGIGGVLNSTWAQASDWAVVQSQLPGVAEAWVSRADDDGRTVRTWIWADGVHLRRTSSAVSEPRPMDQPSAEE